MAKLDRLTDGVTPHLEPGETIQASVQGTYEKNDWTRTGAFFATDRRIVFYGKKVTGFDLESFPYKNVSSVEQGKGMMGATVSFFASGNKVSMKWISDQAALAAFLGIVHGRMNEASAVRPPEAPAPAAPAVAVTSPLPPAASAGDVMQQLKQLGELKDAGVLTEAEFEEKKAEFLKRL